jgi:hypothetical protein
MAKARPARVAVTLSLLFLAACEEEKPRRAPQLVEDERAPPPTWLTPKDDIDPAAWLAAHRSGVAAPDAAEIAGLREALGEAGLFFLESPRMLANRSAQLADMLSAAGLGEDMARLLVDLSHVAGAADKKQTFGELCQHYYNLRRQGQGREQALAALAGRYALQKREP